MMPNAILVMVSGGRRWASFSGTRDPSMRNIGGRPALRWMSDAPPWSAIFRISLSSISPRFYGRCKRGIEKIAPEADARPVRRLLAEWGRDRARGHLQRDHRLLSEHEDDVERPENDDRPQEDLRRIERDERKRLRWRRKRRERSRRVLAESDVRPTRGTARRRRTGRDRRRFRASEARAAPLAARGACDDLSRARGAQLW